MKISSALICKNEERCIKRCLDSYKDVVDEMIVVDTGSTDRTVEIAKECGAQVFHFEWIDDFSAARNYALAQCTGDWIILLDADEWFPEGQAQILKNIMQRHHGDRRYQAVVMYMRNLDMDKERLSVSTNGSIHQSMRAIRNLRGMHYEGRIHEMLHYEDKNINTILVKHEDITILHDGYRADILEDKGRRNVDSNIRTWEETKDPNYLHYAAMDLCNLNENEEALKYFNMYFDTGHYSHYFGTYPHKLAIRTMRLLEYPEEEIRDFIFATADKYPGNAGAQFFKADYYRSQQEYEKAYALYETVVELLGKNPERQLDFGFTIGRDGYAQMFCNMAEIDTLRGDAAEALALYERGLAYKKDHMKAIAGIIRLKRGDAPESVVAYWRKWYNLDALEDLQRLLRAYRIEKPGIEFLLLFEKYFALKQEQDVYFMTMLLIVNEYRQAFEMFSSRHVIAGAANYGVKALLASYLGEHLEWNAEYRDLVDERYMQMVDALRDGTALDEKALGRYILFIGDLLKYTVPGDPRVIKALHPVEVLVGVDKMPFFDLLEQSDHDEATRYLLNTLRPEDGDDVLAQGYRIRTMLEYRLGNEAAAREAIAALRALGKDNPVCDMYEKWLEERHA